MSDKNTDAPLFIDWFAEQYECGMPDEFLYAVCEAYLQGLIDAMPEGANTANLHQCLSVMRSSGVMRRVLKQYGVRVKP